MAPTTTAPGAAELFAAMQTAVLTIAPDGRIERLNPAAESLLNMSAAHIAGRPLTDVISFPAEFDPGGEGRFAAYQLALKTVRGTRLLVDIDVTELADFPGWRLLTMHGGSAAQQVGHRFERTAGARAAIAAAAMLAHEIKNPLSGIRGAAQLVEARLDEDDRRMTRLIRSEVDRVTALVDQMEGFTDTRPALVEPNNIHEIVDHARSVAKSGFGDRLQIVDAYDPSLPLVMAHRDGLIQIVINLLKNAAETAETGGERLVRITTAYRQGVSLSQGARKVPLPIELCVMDDGPGVHPDIADDLFEPFVTTKKSGRGFGLALADKLIRDMGGIIQYAREGDPPLTVFRILLPRA